MEEYKERQKTEDLFDFDRKNKEKNVCVCVFFFSGR